MDMRLRNVYWRFELLNCNEKQSSQMSIRWRLKKALWEGWKRPIARQKFAGGWIKGGIKTEAWLVRKWVRLLTPKKAIKNMGSLFRTMETLRQGISISSCYKWFAHLLMRSMNTYSAEKLNWNHIITKPTPKNPDPFRRYPSTQLPMHHMLLEKATNRLHWDRRAFCN